MHRWTSLPTLSPSIACLLLILTAGSVLADTSLTNEMCPVMPDERAVEAHAVEYEGRTIYLCCRRCIGMFERDPQAYLANLPATEDETAAGHAGDEAHAHDHNNDHVHAATEEVTAPHDAHAETDHHEHVHDEMPALLHWLGHFHVVVVHFPVGLLIAAAVAELLGLASRRRWFHDAGRFCVWAGGLGALVAAPLGWFNAGWVLAHDDWLMASHRWLGTAVFIWAIVLMVLVERVHRHADGRWRLWYWAALFGGAVLVAFTGHTGGMLVFGADYYQW